MRDRMKYARRLTAVAAILAIAAISQPAQAYGPKCEAAASQVRQKIKDNAEALKDHTRDRMSKLEELRKQREDVLKREERNRDEMQDLRCGEVSERCKELAKLVKQDREMRTKLGWQIDDYQKYVDSLLEEIGAGSPIEVFNDAKVKAVCDQEAREERERTAALPPGAATCDEGIAAIAAARQRGDNAALASLMKIVPVVCDRAEKARERGTPVPAEIASAVQGGAADAGQPAGIGGAIGTVSLPPAVITSCTQGKQQIQDMKGSVDAARQAGNDAGVQSAQKSFQFLMSSVQAECDREAQTADHPAVNKKTAKRRQPSGRVGRGTPRTGPSDAEVAAGVMTAIGIIGAAAASSQRSRGPVYGPVYRQPQPRVNCHPRPDGRGMHCGNR